MKTIKLNYWYDLPENYTGIVEYSDGTISYYLNSKTHREDGPAIIWCDGTIGYYLNHNNITKEVNKWLSGETDIHPYEKWDNNTRLIFKLTFG